MYPNFSSPKMGRETNPEASLIALWSLTDFLKNTEIACSKSFFHFVSWQFLYSQTVSLWNCWTSLLSYGGEGMQGGVGS